MAHRFAKVLEEEIEEAFFYPSDLVNTLLATLGRGYCCCYPYPFTSLFFFGLIRFVNYK